MLNNSKMSDISVKGVVLNLLSVGFSTWASFGEFIDNSLGAKATNINIKLSNNRLTYWDNGEGMGKKKLREGHIIANRSESSSEKQGRFGVGDKHAKAHLTQLQFPTLTISKTKPCPEERDNGLNQIIVDWPTIIQEDKYINVASGITYEDRPIWDENAGDLECGTLQHLECHEKIAREIKDNTETNEIINSLLYWLGVSYCNELLNGVRITIDINDSKYEVIPIDPLEWDKIPEINKKETIMEVMSNGNDIVLLLSLNDVEGFYEIHKDKAGRKHIKFYSLADIASLQEQTEKGIEEKDQKINGKRISSYPVNKFFSKELYNTIGGITCRSAYHPDWTDLQSYVYEHIGESVKNQNEESDDNASVNTTISCENEKKKNQDTHKYMGGDLYTRNGKRIKRVDTEQPKRGDKARYPFETNSRHELMFTAKIDDMMGVLVNKSDLKRESISSVILMNFEDIHKKQFIDTQYNLSKSDTPVKPSQINKQTQKVAKKSVADNSSIDSNTGENTKPPQINKQTQKVAKKSVAGNSSIDSNTGENTKTPQVISNENNIKSFEDVEEEEEEEDDEVEPKIKAVGSKNDTMITINQGKQMIKKMFETESKNAELECILNEMIKKYQDRSAPDQIDLLLSEMSLTQKYNIIIKSIQFRYPSESVYDTTNMLYGAELYRTYTETFP